MNKQIEEIAKSMCRNYGTQVCVSCDAHATCMIHLCAVDVYNAGYRKQREGENISQMHPSDEFICEKCGLIIRDCCRYEIDEDNGDETCYEFPYEFCPRCGMKVKGGETEGDANGELR